MRVILDVDGVLLDFVGEVINGTRLDRASVTEWDVFGLLDRIEPGLGEARREACDLPEFWRSLRPIPGAQGFVRNLRCTGAEIVFATAPWIGCFGWESIRRDQLQTWFDARPIDIVFTAWKELIRGDLFIDDNPDNVRRWSRANEHGLALLYPAPYNERWSGERSISSGDKR